jgi:DNA-directed RNA polymerase subunit RPC12/RpoP
MDTFTLVISLALGGCALSLILYPLWLQTRLEATRQVKQSGQTLLEYQARYQATLMAIKDLMFDHEMDKVSTADYESLLAKTKLEAAQIRQQIDYLKQVPEPGLDPALDSEIETAIAQLKSRDRHQNGHKALLREINIELELLKIVGFDTKTRESKCPYCGKNFIAGDAFCSGCGQSLAGVQTTGQTDVCPTCGYAFQGDDIFCAKCGATLNESVEIHGHEEAQNTVSSILKPRQKDQ